MTRHLAPHRSSVDELLTVQQVAARLQVSVRTVRRWISDGLLPCTRLGARCVRVSTGELAAFLARSRGSF